MDYFTYKRFQGAGIDGAFNLKFGTICAARSGFLYAPDGRKICAITSENGWEHFHPNTPEGFYRQTLLDGLYQYYRKKDSSDDFDAQKWPGQENFYWKNLLRTMNTGALRDYYRARLGEPPEQEGLYV
jgi:hypothetical protein